MANDSALQPPRWSGASREARPVCNRLFGAVKRSFLTVAA